MHKIFTFFVSFFALLTFTPNSIFAKEFTTSADVTYNVLDNGDTEVTYNITIENASESALQKGYDLMLSHVTPREIEAKEDGKVVPPELKGTSDETHIILRFEKPVNGLGKRKQIEVSFVTDSIAEQTGDIWEIYIPRLIREDSFNTYNVELFVPESFGEEGYIVPRGSMTHDEKGRVYTFEKTQMSESGVQATFGKFQVYTFDLTYHLENDSWRTKNEEIALPPDTSIQKIYITEISPKPIEVISDEDENWLAQYTLTPFTSYDVTVKGKAVVFSSPRKILAPKIHSIVENTKSTTYWQSDDSTIKKLAEELKTPEAIYTYVVSTLSYNYNNAVPGRQRLGAVEALKKPDQVICMEFTDLFIALARAAGIPAREIEGYALSDNPKVQPLSLSNDVLHSWPEYWDSERQIWIPVDPTWGDTTNGQDFFKTFDLKHIAFVIHGKSDMYPHPAGSYKNEGQPQKDVYVALSKLENESPGKIDVSYTQVLSNPFNKSMWEVTIKNTGTTAVYGQNIELILDGNSQLSHHIALLPPLSQQKVTIEAPTGVLGVSQARESVLVAGDRVVHLPVTKTKTILFQIGVIFGILSLIILSTCLIIYRKKVFGLFRKIVFKSHEINLTQS